MPGIEIPEGYWTIRPSGFAERTAFFSPQFSAIARDVVGGAAPVLNGNDVALRGELAGADGEADAISTAAATNRAALDTTPTGDVLAATGAADNKTAVTDQSDAAAAAYVIPGLVISGPPPLDGRDGGPYPGGTEPPPPDPGQGPPPAVAWITALYEELLGREPDGGGMSSWLAYMAAGHTIDEVRAGIIGSPEYQQKHGGEAPSPSAPPPSEPAPPPPPIDVGQFVTHEQLQQVLDNIETTITLVV